MVLIWDNEKERLERIENIGDYMDWLTREHKEKKMTTGNEDGTALERRGKETIVTRKGREKLKRRNVREDERKEK